MKKALLLLTALLLASSCQPFPWEQTLAHIQAALIDFDVKVVRSVEPNDTSTPLAGWSDTNISVFFKRPYPYRALNYEETDEEYKQRLKKEGGACFWAKVYLGRGAIKYTSEQLQERFLLEKTEFLFWSDYEDCFNYEQPDPKLPW